MKNKLTLQLLALFSAFALSACGDSKESVADDLVDQMKKSTDVMASGDKDAIAKFAEENNKLVERAKAVGIDLDDPSTYPEKLKKAMADQKSEILPAAKATAKEYIDESSEIPESAKKMMKKVIDSSGKE